MITTNITFSNDETYLKAKAAATLSGKNLTMPDKQTGAKSWAEEAFEEKLEREGK